MVHLQMWVLTLEEALKETLPLTADGDRTAIERLLRAQVLGQHRPLALEKTEADGLHQTDGVLIQPANLAFLDGILRDQTDHTARLQDLVELPVDFRHRGEIGFAMTAVLFTPPP